MNMIELINRIYGGLDYWIEVFFKAVAILILLVMLPLFVISQYFSQETKQQAAVPLASKTTPAPTPVTKPKIEIPEVDQNQPKATEFYDPYPY